MKVGFDYWQVLSHYPDYFGWLIDRHIEWGDEVHIISAIGKRRAGTIQGEVAALGINRAAHVHELIFSSPKESPELKLAKCQELGIQVFYDDRDDVCRLLNKHGILAMRVTRKDNSTYDMEADLEAERT
jgi:acid phosphatase class B